MLQTYAKECEGCNKKFNSAEKKQRFCSLDCLNKNRKESKKKNCEVCGCAFYYKHKYNKYCSRECAGKARRTLKQIICPICGVLFKQKYSWQKYCSRECVNVFNRTEEHQRIIEDKANERYQKTGVKRPCQLPQVRRSGKDISKINLKYKELFESYGYDVSIEFPLGNYSYDLKIGNTLIEINPTPTHNSTWGPAFEGIPTPKPKKYHCNKCKNAMKNGFKCIMIWDWTKEEEIFKQLKERFTYNGEPNLHWFNCKTRDHIIDEGFDKSDMVNKGYVEIYDCGNILYC